MGDLPAVHDTAWLLLIGNELLSGKVTDTNGPHAIARLRERGVALAGIEVVPDLTGRIAGAIRRARTELQPAVIVTSGGIGPTHDDITLAAVAAAFDRPVERNAELVELIRTHYDGRFTDELLRMADLPAGAELVYPEGSRYPLVRIANVWCLPGEPTFFRRKFDSLMQRLNPPGAIATRKVYTRCEEGPIAALLRKLQERWPDVAIGSYPRYDRDAAAWSTLLTLDSRDAVRIDELLDALLANLDPADVVNVERT